MITKNKKNNIEEITLDKVNGNTDAEKITEIIDRQKEIEETLNFLLTNITSKVKRKETF